MLLCRTLQTPTFSKIWGYFTTSDSGHFSSMNFHFHQIHLWFLPKVIDYLSSLLKPRSPVVSPAEVANCFRGF